MSKVGWSMPAPTMTRMPPRATWLKPASMAARCPEHSSTTCDGPGRHALGLPGGEDLEVGRVDDRGHTELGRQPAASLVRLDHRDVVDTHGPQRGHAQRADRAGAEDHDAVARRDARPGDAVQGHRQRLGQRGVAGREALGQAQDAGGAAQDVLGEGAVGVLARSCCCGSRTATACPPGSAGRCRTWATGPPTTSSPTDQSGDVVAHGGDRPAPLVAGDRARREAPAVAQLVDVGPADAARVHAHDDLVRPGPRDRALLDGDDAGRLVDGRRHHLGQRVHRR